MMNVVRVSYFEIYNYEIRDLLSRDSTTLLEVEEYPDIGTYLKDVTTFIVNNIDDMDRVMTFGNKNRLVRTDCQRSHAIFSITVESRQAEENGEEHVKIGCLHLVDLFQIGSGNRNDSEKQCQVEDDDNNDISNSYNYIKRTLSLERRSEIGNTKQRLHERTKINLPLTTLQNVISALVNRKCIQIPYCNSKLKHLLQNSLDENLKTVTSGSNNNNIDEIVSEIALNSRTKYISNRTKTNKDALLSQFQQEIKILKHQLDGIAEITLSDNEVEVEISTENKIDGKHFKMNKKTSINTDQFADRNCDINQNSEEINNFKQHTNNKAHDEQIAAIREHKQMLLQDKLHKLEKKIFSSEENLVEKFKQQEKLLQIFTKKLKKIQSEEELLKKKLKKKKAERGDMEAKHSTLKKKAFTSSENLTKFQDLLQLAQEEQKEVIKDNQYEMERRLDVLKQLTKEIGLQKALIKNYIPNKFKELIVQHLHWNKDIGEWQLQYIATGKNTKKSFKIKMDPEVSLNVWIEYIKTLYKLKKSSDSSTVWFTISPENHQERLYSFI